MTDIKTDFKAWLQEHFSQSAASGYYSSVKKVFDEHFDDNQDWQQHSKSILPLLARYFEFANREYLLDRVTIWYALDYFKKITDFIEEGNIKEQEENVEISIFDGDTFYPVCSVRLSQLYDAVLTIQTYLFNIPSNLKPKNENTPVNIARLAALLVEIETTSALKDLKDAAIHIVYDNKNNSRKKTALSHYCDFLYSLTADSLFDYKSKPVVNIIKKENPKVDVDNFIEIKPITGEQARQIKPNVKTKRFTDGNYVYSTKDLTKIFDIDFNTATNLMSRFGQTFKIKTILDSYYCANATNLCLRRYHHYRSRKKSSLKIDYTKAGYEQWKTRKEAMTLLGIKKLAFYTHVANKCLYIDYAQGAPRYYLPELEYFKNSPEIQKISKRKYHKNKILCHKQTHSKMACNI